VNDNILKQTFVSIITKGRKSNTYKFALAKFLLDYCNSQTPQEIENSITNNQSTFVDYQQVANAFLTYFWHQECKYRIKQNYQDSKPPSVIRIIRNVFGTDYIPESFKNISKDKKQIAQKDIRRKVFGKESQKTSQVIPRFQNIKDGNSVIRKQIFYNYDDEAGQIEIKPEAVKFFSENYIFLIKLVILEWCKFLEKINTLPRLIAKVESYEIKRGSLSKYVKIFREFKTCFYCNASLDSTETHVDHFIPWSYIFEDESWNLVLSCEKCNLKKSDSLANPRYLTYLIERNNTYKKKIEDLRKSLLKIDTQKGWQNEITHHYNNCKEYGFSEIVIT
jgi:5-methylcytosine-specific restriction endonuclease McrA